MGLLKCHPPQWAFTVFAVSKPFFLCIPRTLFTRYNPEQGPFFLEETLRLHYDNKRFLFH